MSKDNTDHAMSLAAYLIAATPICGCVIVAGVLANAPWLFALGAVALLSIALVGPFLIMAVGLGAFDD